VQEGLYTEDSRRQFQYAYGINDGVNPVQETSGATVLANILTGLGIDELFTRTDVPAATTSHLLPDALGSALALADSAGAVQTEYTYEPFGKTTVTGASNTNPFQYTGRENDGTGLYYYRARYYHPGLQRFISEDPIEFVGGGINLYAYVANNPVIFSDPNGLEAPMFPAVPGPNGTICHPLIGCVPRDPPKNPPKKSKSEDPQPQTPQDPRDPCDKCKPPHYPSPPPSCTSGGTRCEFGNPVSSPPPQSLLEKLGTTIANVIGSVLTTPLDGEGY
jgi:RHS repeat-associated protein